MSKNKLAGGVLAIALLAGTVISAVNVASAGNAPTLPSKTSDYKCVSPNSLVTYKELALAGEVVMIDVAGSNLADMNVYVYDEHGNLLASDTTYGNSSFVMLVSEYTEYLTIEVVNNSFSHSCYGITVTYI